MYLRGVTTPELDPLEFLQLVADPVRWQVMGELARSDRRVNELTAQVGKPQNVVSYHLRQLRAAGLVSARQSSADGRDTYYCVDLHRCSRLFRATAIELHPGLQLAPLTPPPHRHPSRRAPRVLFLCTGNSARSPMAEALLRARSGNTVDARSAGSHPKALHPRAVEVMAERGIDISGRSSTHLDRYARTRFDHVVTLCDRVREVHPEFPGTPTVAHWSLADPSAATERGEAIRSAFEQTAAELDARIEFFLPQLTVEPEPGARPHER